MSYIGRGTESISNVEVLDNLTFDGSASYTLQKSSTNFVPSSANNLLISISGVVQQGNFTVSGSTITFDTTVSASDTCDWILHYGTGLITTVADGARTEAKLGSSAVTTAKINDSAITTAKINDDAVTYAKTDGNFGKIGQVLNDHTATQLTTSSGTFATTGQSLSITPSSTSSKVFITFDAVASTLIANKGVTVAIYRGATNILEKNMYQAQLNGNLSVTTVLSFLDSPSTTSSTTYEIYYKGFGVSGNINLSKRTLTLMEVLA